MLAAKYLTLLAVVAAMGASADAARTNYSPPAYSNTGSGTGAGTASTAPTWAPAPTSQAPNPDPVWPQPYPQPNPNPNPNPYPQPDPTTKPKRTTAAPTWAPEPTETEAATTTAPVVVETEAPVTTAPAKAASTSGSLATTAPVNHTVDVPVVATKAVKTAPTLAAAVQPDTEDANNEAAVLPATATVSASQSTYGKHKTSGSSSNSAQGNTKAAAGGGGSLSGLLTIIGVLVGAVVIGVMSIMIVKKRREDEGEDDDDEDWDMQHLEVKSTVPSTRASQQAYAPDPTHYQPQRPTYRASEKMMMMPDPRMSNTQNVQPVVMDPPVMPAPQSYQEFRDTENMQYTAAVPAQQQQPEQFNGDLEYNGESECIEYTGDSECIEYNGESECAEYTGESECADSFLEEHVTAQYQTEQAAQQYLATQDAAEHFLVQNGQAQENDIEGDEERESEMPVGTVDIDEPTPSEAYEHNQRASEQSLGGMAVNMTQQYSQQLYSAPQSVASVNEVSIDEGSSEMDLGTSVASGLSSIGDNFMEQQVYEDEHMSRASEEVQEGLEFPQTDLGVPPETAEQEQEQMQQEEATGSTYCDRSSFGVFSVRDASFDSAVQDPRYSQDSTFSVGTDVDIDDHDNGNNGNGTRCTELDEEFEV